MRSPRALTRLVSALRDALEGGHAAEALVDNLTGAPFGEQKALAYYEPRRVSERMVDLAANRAVRNRMLDTIERGVEMGADKWYDTAPLYAAFVAELGPDEGKAAFRRFMEFNAAVSPRSDVSSQLKRASFFYGADRRGEGIPWTPDNYGHFAQKVHRQLMEQLGKDGLSPRTAPKTASFAENLSGNQAPVTIDSHATALPAIFAGDPRWLKTGKHSVQWQGEEFVPRTAFKLKQIDVDDALEHPSWWGGRPLESEYKALADYYANLGKEAGLSGPQAQAAAWVGGGDITGVQSGPEPFMAQLVERVRETAEARGKSFEETLRDMIRGKEPLLAMMLALQAALASEER